MWFEYVYMSIYSMTRATSARGKGIIDVSSSRHTIPRMTLHDHIPRIIDMVANAGYSGMTATAIAERYASRVGGFGYVRMNAGTVSAIMYDLVQHGMAERVSNTSSLSSSPKWRIICESEPEPSAPELPAQRCPTLPTPSTPPTPSAPPTLLSSMLAMSGPFDSGAMHVVIEGTTDNESDRNDDDSEYGVLTSPSDSDRDDEEEDDWIVLLD